MKKSLAATLLLLGASLAHADTPKFVNADGSELSAQCIALLDAGYLPSVNDPETSGLLCNGQPARAFVRKHLSLTGAEASTSRPAKVVFRPSNASPETELCLAALSSPITLEAVKKRHPELASRMESELRCNNLPFKAFVKKYAKGGEITASL